MNRVACFRQSECCIAKPFPCDKNSSLRVVVKNTTAENVVVNPQGAQGLSGARASWWYLGIASNPNITPPTFGPRPFQANDFYLQSTTGQIWRFNGTVWQLVANNAGIQGADGNMWYRAPVDPVDGVILVPPQTDGDVWWNTTTNDVFIYDANLDQWIFRQNITGPPGDPDIRGSLYWYTGSVPPTPPLPFPRFDDIWLDTPVNMDMYQNTNPADTPANWTLLYSIKGPPGDTGPPGAVGAQGPTNTSAAPNCWSVQFNTHMNDLIFTGPGDGGFGGINDGWATGVISPTTIVPILSNPPASLDAGKGAFTLLYEGVYLIHYMIQGKSTNPFIEISSVLVNSLMHSVNIAGSSEAKKTSEFTGDKVFTYENSVVLNNTNVGFEFELGVRGVPLEEEADIFFLFDGNFPSESITATVSVVLLQLH